MKKTKKNPGARARRSGAEAENGFDINPSDNTANVRKRQRPEIKFTLERRRLNEKRIRAALEELPGPKWFAKPLPPLKTLNERFWHHPVTKNFQYRPGKEPHSLQPGEFHTTSKGYQTVTVCGETYLCHRLSWKLAYSIDPPGLVDHLNSFRSDNRAANLRIVNHFQNTQERVTKKSATGFTGITYDSKRRKYEAKIGVRGCQIRLGRFTALECAKAARKHAEKLVCPTFDREQELQIRRAAR